MRNLTARDLGPDLGRPFISLDDKRKVLQKKKNALNLSINVFSTKVLIGDTIL